VDISVIVTLHNEGRLAHRTLRSLEMAVRHARSEGRCVETVVVQDRATDETLLGIASDWQSKEHCECHLLVVDFGCLSQSRNLGIAASKGEYIAILDGDDLIGEKWLVVGHEACRTVERSIAHHELSCLFPRNNYVFRHREISEPAQLLEHNPLAALVVAKRNTFEEVPYISDTNQYGYEDWLWNCQTTGRGFRHIVVPKTLAAIRQKVPSESLCKKTEQAGKTVRPNELFKRVLSSPPIPDAGCSMTQPINPSGIVTELPPAEADQRPAFVRGFIGLVNRLAASSWLAPLKSAVGPDNRARIRQMARLATAIFFPPAEPADLLPSWARQEIKQLAKLEPQLNNYKPWQIDFLPPTRLHSNITKCMEQLIRTSAARVFVLPWIARGGAELCALHYMHAVRERCFLITTEPCPNEWASRLPPEAVHIDIGNGDLSHREKKVLLLRLIVQADTEFVHIVNSQVAFDVLTEFRAALQGRRVFTSLFATEITEDGEEAGYAVSHFPLLTDSFTRVSTDNVAFKKKLDMVYGLHNEHCVVHRMPFSPPHFPTRQSSGSEGTKEASRDGKCTRLLYASRLTREKIPEVAIDAVHQLGSEGIDVTLDVWGEADSGFTLRTPSSPYVQFRGGYDGIENLPLYDYDLLVYTSLSDGLPNVVIECLGNGLPVVASDVGGLHEIVNEQTGWLVDERNNAASFKEALHVIIKNRELLRKKGENARAFVCQSHSWESFERQVQKFYWDQSPPTASTMSS
jgi:glycosyltransferase involved in cell wall biosynthesis